MIRTLKDYRTAKGIEINLNNSNMLPSQMAKIENKPFDKLKVSEMIAYIDAMTNNAKERAKILNELQEIIL